MRKTIYRYTGCKTPLVMMIQQYDEGDTPSQRVILFKESGKWRTLIATLEVSHPDFMGLGSRLFALEALGFSQSEGLVQLMGTLTFDHLEVLDA